MARVSSNYLCKIDVDSLEESCTFKVFIKIITTNKIKKRRI